MKRKSLLLIAIVGIILATLPPPSTQACTFCNLTGYVNCDTYTGTSCSSEGASKRCYVYGCYCEWGFCRCEGGVWQCYW